MPSRLRKAALGALALLSPLTPAAAQDAAPRYSLRYLGEGGPSGMNADGVVIGARLDAAQRYQPLVAAPGEGWAPLPLPEGAVQGFPTDVNNPGTIVGVAFDARWNATALRWQPQAGGGWAVEVLPRLPGDDASYATALNDLGQVVGARRALGYVPAATTGWLYSDADGVVDLLAEYGFAVYPVELNTLGQVIAGGEWLDLETGENGPIGDPPPQYQAVTAVKINNRGVVAGSSALRDNNLNVRSVFRYQGGVWENLAGSSRFTQVSSLNEGGDVGYSEGGPGVYLEGHGLVAVADRLDQAAVDAGWIVPGPGVHINDARVLATFGRNRVTGEAGGVVLTPVEGEPEPLPDAGLEVDAAPADAAPADAAPQADAAPAPDAAPRADAAPPADAAPQPDAAPQADAAPTPDRSVPDAPEPDDGGPASDASTQASGGGDSGCGIALTGAAPPAAGLLALLPLLARARRRRR